MFTKRTIIIGLSLLLLLGNCFAEMPTELAFHSIPTSLIEHDFRAFLDQFDVLEGIGFYKCGDLNVKKLDALEQSNIRFEISVWKYVFSDVEEKYLDTLEFTHFAKRPTNQHEDESIRSAYFTFKQTFSSAELGALPVYNTFLTISNDIGAICCHLYSEGEWCGEDYLIEYIKAIIEKLNAFSKILD